MKILHINQSDISGGAGIAGYRLHQGLLDRDINSRLLVGEAKTQSDRVATVVRQPRWEHYLGCLSKPLGFNYINLFSSFNIPQHPFYQDADLLNFHNLHTDYFSYLAIPALTKNKPAVFTLHDMWSFTGHCTYSYECDRWKSGCGKCPHPDTYPKIERDNTRWEWKLKNWLYSRSNMTIITLSNWLTKQVKASMLNCFDIHHIPNGIDTQAYQPIESEYCRQVLGIPKDKKVLMFAAESLINPRKGGDLLLAALQSLPKSLQKEIVLLSLGNGSEKIANLIDTPTVSLGYINSDRLKSAAYSAADLFVFPTRADNFPLMLQESMACGTPMVSFDVGGVKDLVRPDTTGYLAKSENTQDFAKGIIQLLEDEALRETMQRNCRQIATNEYTLELQIQRYLEVYQRLLQTQTNNTTSLKTADNLAIEST